MSILDKRLPVSRLDVDQHLRVLTYDGLLKITPPTVATTGYYQSRRLLKMDYELILINYKTYPWQSFT